MATKRVSLIIIQSIGTSKLSTLTPRPSLAFRSCEDQQERPSATDVIRQRTSRECTTYSATSTVAVRTLRWGPSLTHPSRNSLTISCQHAEQTPRNQSLWPMREQGQGMTPV
jgi:hypothetical protein